jgi:hypothetical protein
VLPELSLNSLALHLSGFFDYSFEVFLSSASFSLFRFRFSSVQFLSSSRHGQVSFIFNYCIRLNLCNHTLFFFHFSFGDNPWDASNIDPNNFDQQIPEYAPPSSEELEAQIRALAASIESGNLEPLYYAVASVATALMIPICRDLLSRLGSLGVENRRSLCKSGLSF